MRPHKWFINCNKRGLGKWLFNFCSRPVVLLTLEVIALMCSLTVKDVSNMRPKCFCDETCWTGLLLKKIGGCTTFFTLQLKITSCVYLDGSGLKLIFHWKFHSVILSKSSKSFLAVAFGSFIIVNKKVLSAKCFVFYWRFWLDRLYTYKKNRDPRIEPCGTPALMKPHDEHWPLSKTCCFLHLGTYQ